MRRQAAPPRFVVRTLVVALATVAFVLTAVLLVVTLRIREEARAAVVEKLETGQRLLATLEQQRGEELRAQLRVTAENPTVKAALDTYRAEHETSPEPVRRQLLKTIEGEIDKLARRFQADVLAVRDADGRLLVASGPRAGEWTAPAAATDEGAYSSFVLLPSGAFRAASVPLTLQDTVLGSLQLAQALDDDYAIGLTTLSGARTLIVTGNTAIADTLPPEAGNALTPEALRTMADTDVVTLAGVEYAVRPLVRERDTAIYVLESIDAAARPAIAASLRAMALIACGALVLAAIASLWLARTVSRPIDRLSTSLDEMTRAHDFDRPVPPSGDSREIDTLIGAFNSMMDSVKRAEAETLSAYLGAIRALALALDARDPYTAGHSERVSAMSAAVGRHLRLDDQQIEVLRLGALLHDIGKIGISDQILRKAGPLTPKEVEVIKQHPGVGARILRSVRFFEPHIPIVELHHERPDGRGYPHGLRGDEIPLLARIVHVADAFDAMTSARAYRPARAASEGLRELWRCAGTEFDAEVVQALVAALPAVDVSAPVTLGAGPSPAVVASDGVRA